MKKLFAIWLLISIPLWTFSQAIIDSTYDPAVDKIYSGGLHYNQGYIAPLITHDFARELIFFDDSLRFNKSLPLPPGTPDSVGLGQCFTFNGKTYTLGRGDAVVNTEFLYEVHPSTLSPVSQFNIDTVKNTAILQVDSINPNTLRLLCVKKTDPTQLFYDQSVILELDSSFAMQDYRLFKFDSVLAFKNPTIDGYHKADDSTAHIFASHMFIKYNLDQSTIDTAYYLRGKVNKIIPLGPSQYLVAGILRYPDEELDSLAFAPIFGEDAIGFYRMSSAGYPIDTSYILHEIDSSFQSFLTSSLRIGGPTLVMTDSNNIYMAAEAEFQPISATEDKNYIWIVKLDSRGNEKWRFEFGGRNRSFAPNAITLSPDGGCAVFGASLNQVMGIISAIRIKLGPDGTLSDIEVMEPEDLVQFYPNPVKDVLHYTYLPPAKGRYSLSIFDLKGSAFGTYELSSSDSAIPVQLPTGFYLYELTDENGKAVQLGKIVAE